MQDGIRNRKLCSSNLNMIYNLPESTNDDSESRKESDIKFTQQLEKHLGVKLDSFKGFGIGTRVKLKFGHIK